MLGSNSNESLLDYHIFEERMNFLRLPRGSSYPTMSRMSYILDDDYIQEREEYILTICN